MPKFFQEMVQDKNVIENLEKIADRLAKSGAYPATGGNPNTVLAQILAACEIDYPSVSAYLKKSYRAKPGSSFAHDYTITMTMMKKSKVLKGAIKHKFDNLPKPGTVVTNFPDNFSCTAFGVDAETGETLEYTLTWAEVKAEGWLSSSYAKWRTIPVRMMQMRASTWFITMYYPHVASGDDTNELMPAIEENEDEENAIEETTSPFAKALLEGKIDNLALDIKATEVAALPEPLPLKKVIEEENKEEKKEALKEINEEEIPFGDDDEEITLPTIDAKKEFAYTPVKYSEILEELIAKSIYAKDLKTREDLDKAISKMTEGKSQKQWTREEKIKIKELVVMGEKKK